MDSYRKMGFKREIKQILTRSINKSKFELFRVKCDINCYFITRISDQNDKILTTSCTLQILEANTTGLGWNGATTLRRWARSLITTTTGARCHVSHSEGISNGSSGFYAGETDCSWGATFDWGLSCCSLCSTSSHLYLLIIIFRD